MTDTTTSAVERLAKDTEITSNMINMGERIQWGSETALMDQCAATLRALAAERDELREALAPFAAYMTTEEGRLDLDNRGEPVPDSQGVGWVYLTHGDFRAAESALTP